MDSDIDAENITDEKLQNTDYSKKSKPHFAKLRTELTDEDLASSGVQKMLLAEITRLESEVISTSNYQDKFYKADKESAILIEKQKTFVLVEVLYSTSLTLGAVLLGFSPSVKMNEVIQPWMIGGIGILLIIGAIVTKVFKK